MMSYSNSIVAVDLCTITLEYKLQKPIRLFYILWCYMYVKFVMTINI